MRGLFFLLLLSNLIYLAVQYVGGTSEMEMDPYRGVKFEKKGLALLSELPADKRPALRDGVKPEPGLAPWPEEDVKEEKTADATNEGAKPAVDVCMRVGAIRNESQLQTLRQSLRKLGADEFKSGGDTTGSKASSKYWVMLPPYPDLDKATEAAAALKALQVKDFFVVRSGEYQKAVSLGVFSTRERAERRQAQIAGLQDGKWSAKIEEIGGGAATGDYFWISFKLGNETSLAKVRNVLHKQGLTEFKEIGCE